MKSISSLFAKIIAWFFLNMILVATVLSIFFAFQPHIKLLAIFGQQGRDRLRAAGMLIAHDLSQMPQSDWPDILERHAAIYGVDFTIVLENGSRASSTDDNLPEAIMIEVRDALRHKPPRGRHKPPRGRLPLPHRPEDSQQMSKNHPFETSGGLLKKDAIVRKPPIPPGWYDEKPHLIMRTKDPTRYWSGLRIPLPLKPFQPPVHAILLAVSDSMTGNGFFFDLLHWLMVAVVVILISALFWIPMVRNITRPLARMSRATEEIAEGNFDVSLHEPRSDEIGRLAKAISHMTARLSALVKGQKRFLGDVAHELGSPIARIQFGLGALEQRVEEKNQKRVIDVLEDVDHLSKLVNELLAFSRADIKSSTVKLESVALLPIAQTAVERERTSSAEIIVDIDADIRVHASAELLTRALANLFRNAVKYTVRDGSIRVTAEKSADKVIIEVSDNGPGVPENLLDQLFEPFFRPEPSRDRDSGGVGLGLAIVKTCVEACKGTVSAANLQPNGFAVTITLNT